MHRVFINHKDYIGNMLIFFIVLIAKTFSQFNFNYLTRLINSILIPILAVRLRFLNGRILLRSKELL